MGSMHCFWLFVETDSSFPANGFNLSVVMPFLISFLGFNNVLFVGESIILLILFDWMLDFRANNKWLLFETEEAKFLFLLKLFHTYIVDTNILLFYFHFWELNWELQLTVFGVSHSGVTTYGFSCFLVLKINFQFFSFSGFVLRLCSIRIGFNLLTIFSLEVKSLFEELKYLSKFDINFK